MSERGGNIFMKLFGRAQGDRTEGAKFIAEHNITEEQVDEIPPEETASFSTLIRALMKQQGLNTPMILQNSSVI